MKQNVLCGVDRTDELNAFLAGRRVALLTAASGVSKQGISTYRIIADMSHLIYLFTPEHGLASAMQDGGFGQEAGVPHPSTGARLYDISALNTESLALLLKEVDIAVYDIQDVGARFYTYLSSLAHLMRAARVAGVPVLVLDRPNPITNTAIEGLILDESRFSSFVGEYAIPTRYGLTAGEYARYINREKSIDCELHVLACVGWQVGMYYDETDLLWVNPSPNIPSVNAAINYIGSCIYEGTNLSEGRGTTRPFDWLGAPYLDADRLARDMTALDLPGVVFRALDFTPGFNKHAGEVCHGVELHITNRAEYRPFETMLHMFRRLKREPSFVVRRDSLSLRLGRDLLCEDYDPASVLDMDREERERYCENVEKYRIYR